MKPLPAAPALAVACLLPAVPAEAFDAYLRITYAGSTVPTDAVHSWVEVLGFSHGGDSGLDSGGVPLRFQPRACTLQLGQDRVIANLMDAVPLGRPRDLTIQVPRFFQDQVTVLHEIRFKDCYFSKVAASLHPGADQPVFDIGFAYSQIEWTVTLPDPKGNKALAIGSGYDAVEVSLIDRGEIAVPVPGSYAGGTDPEPDGDLDDDGIPDAWETANGLNPNNPADAAADSDADGFSNRDEYITGTNPRSGTSFFRATVSPGGGQNPGGITLTWNSIPGKTYTILATQDLAQPFLPIGTVTGAAGGQTSHVVSLSAGRFFKLSVTE